MHSGVGLQRGQAQVAAFGLEGDRVGDDEAHAETSVELAEVDVSVLAHVDVLHAVELEALQVREVVDLRITMCLIPSLHLISLVQAKFQPFSVGHRRVRTNNELQEVIHLCDIITLQFKTRVQPSSHICQSTSDEVCLAVAVHSCAQEHGELFSLVSESIIIVYICLLYCIMASNTRSIFLWFY